MYDDFGKVAADMDVEFTSSSDYVGEDNKRGQGHVIAPGEHIVLVYTAIRTGEEIRYYTSNENLVKKVGGGIMSEEEFNNGRITKKFGFEVEQIVNQ